MTKRRSLMLVSQSNTGSTWFASAIRIACPGVRTSRLMKEWFNPVLNWEHRALLSTCLGSELPGTINNLAGRPDPDELERAVASWDDGSLDFTKENYLAYQLEYEAFTSRFDMIGLLGEAEDCFPPQRIRVMIWYLSWYESLLRNERFTPALKYWLDENATTVEKKAIVGWQTVHWKLQQALGALKAPVVSYRILTTETEESLFRHFDSLELPAPLQAKTLARVVVETKVTQEKSQRHNRQWSEAFEFLPEYRAKVAALKGQ